MKKKLLFILTITFNLIATAQTIQIVDSKFEKALIELGLDDEIDGYIIENNIINVTELNISNKEIENINEIKYFTSLINLNCSNNLLTELDLNDLTQLEELDCKNNNISNIKINFLQNIKKIDCSNNLIESLNIIQSRVLVSLRCDNNKLTELILPVFEWKFIEEVFLWNNQLSELNFQYIKNLKRLDLGYNLFETINTLSNTKLEVLRISNNPLKEVKINTPNLNFLYAENYSLTELNLSNTNLESAFISGNNLEFINLDGVDLNKINGINLYEPNNIKCIQVNDVSLASEIGGLKNYTQFLNTNCSSVLSVKTNEIKNIIVYPNPSQEKISIENITNFRLATIMDLNSKIILQSKNKNINISNLKPNIYLLKIEYADKILTRKIIKK